MIGCAVLALFMCNFNSFLPFFLLLTFSKLPSQIIVSLLPVTTPHGLAMSLSAVNVIWLQLKHVARPRTQGRFIKIIKRDHGTVWLSINDHGAKQLSGDIILKILFEKTF
jgi:hypothetical protein